MARYTKNEWLKAMRSDGTWKTASDEVKARRLVDGILYEWRSDFVTRGTVSRVLDLAFATCFIASLCELDRQIERFPELAEFKN